MLLLLLLLLLCCQPLLLHLQQHNTTPNKVTAQPHHVSYGVLVSLEAYETRLSNYIPYYC